MLTRAKQAKARLDDYLSAAGKPLSTTWIVLLALASGAVFLLLMNMEVGIYDEALVLQGAVQVGAGQVPHRDFFWIYGPMQLWVVSGLFSVFGESVAVARIYDIAVRVGIVLLSGLAARRMGLRPSLVVAVMAIQAAVFVAARFFLYPVYPSILCALAGTLLLFHDGAMRDARAGRTVAAGMLTGVTALFRYDIGFFLLAAHVLALAFIAYAERAPFRLLARQVFVYGVGISIVFLPVAAAALAVGAIPGFFHDIVAFPPANYARMRSLPWPVPGPSLSSLLPLIVYVPFLAAALGLAWLLGTKPRGPGRAGFGAGAALAVALLLMIGLFALKGIVRVSFIHSVLALIPAMILLVFLASRTAGRKLQLPTLAVLGAASLLILASGLSALRADARSGFEAAFPSQVLRGPPAALRDERCAARVDLGLGVVSADTYRAACFLAAHSRPDEPVFVGAARHDRIYINNVALYFFSGRRPATNWYHLEPGLQTTEEVQRDIVADLIANDVRWVLLDSIYADVEEPNESAISSGVCLLDRFIADRYGEVARFGTVAVLMRREGLAPSRGLPASCEPAPEETPA